MGIVSLIGLAAGLNAWTFAGPRVYISGELSREELGPLRAAGCRVSVVPAAGHVLMWDNLPGFAAAVAAALRAESGEPDTAAHAHEEGDGPP